MKWPNLIFIFFFGVAPCVFAQDKAVIVENVLNQVETSVAIQDPNGVEPGPPDKDKAVALETEVFHLRHISASEAVNKIRELLGAAPGEVTADDRAAKIVVTAAPGKMDEVRKWLVEMDKGTDISFEVKVVRVDLNDEHQNGIDWEAIVSDFKNFGSQEHGNLWSIGTLSREDGDVLLEALETVGETRTVAAAQATVASQQQVDLRLKALDEDDVTVGVLSMPSAGSPQEDLRERFTARFLITPDVNADQSFVMTVVPSQNNVLKTAVLVKKDHIIVIGSVFTHRKVEFTKKFPFLGDLPFLGAVFRGQSTVVQKIENIIFLTPNVSPLKP